MPEDCGGFQKFALNRLLLWQHNEGKIMAHAQHTGLSNLQLELLKLYARNVSEADLKAIRYLIGLYFAEKATADMDKFVEENKITPEQLSAWAYEHWRAESRA